MESRKSLWPLLYILLLNAVGAALLHLAGREMTQSTGILFLALCLVSVLTYTFVRVFSLGDSYLFLIIALLSSIGVIMQLRIKQAYGIRQMKFFLLGTLCYFVVCIIYRNVRVWHKMAPLYATLSVVLFAATMIFGRTSHGAQNWIIIRGVSIQPSELIRILYVMLLAALFTQPTSKMRHKIFPNMNDAQRRLLVIALLSYMHIGFLLLQREWGIASLFFCIYFAFLYVYGYNWRFLLFNVLLAGGGAAAGVLLMSHIRVRVETWLHPFADVNGKGYQITQSLFAIGEGGFDGRGIGLGSPYFIPEVHSDFIFSAICEEMGILGGLAVVMLFFVLVYRGFKIALRCTNPFHKAVAMGLSTMLGVQTFIIVGGVIKLIPLTGITLPFISYGGSSMITTFMALGILQGISSMEGEMSDEIK